MKRLTSMILALAVLVCGASAMAEELPWKGGYAIGEDPQAIDLTGDGEPETVYVETIPDDFESFQRLHAVGAGGEEAVYDAEIISSAGAWTCDLDGDGQWEIFLWGDVMSDDYYTWCLHYAGDHFAPVLFADTSRGENGDGYFKSGYGMLDDVDADAGTITLCGSQDILGTYFMSRTLALSEDGLFELADDRWVRDLDPALLSDPEFWEGYSVLNPVVSVPIMDGEPLEPGERFVITGSDKSTEATFITREGRIGTLSISDDYQRGWGRLVDGIPEDELFEYVTYAD